MWKNFWVMVKAITGFYCFPSLFCLSMMSYIILYQKNLLIYSNSPRLFRNWLLSSRMDSDQRQDLEIILCHCNILHYISESFAYQQIFRVLVLNCSIYSLDKTVINLANKNTLNWLLLPRAMYYYITLLLIIDYYYLELDTLW